jgi:acetyl-CoA carboxylase biotin carboxyl carrier protein
MIDLDFLERLIKVLDESSVDSLEIERGGTRVSLSKTPRQPVVASPHALPQSLAVPMAGMVPAASAEGTVSSAEHTRVSSNLIDIESPMVGTFYRGPAPDAPPYVDTGTDVEPGDTLCIIEAMKLMNEFECEVKGAIVEICVENAQPVEYGQVLFRVDQA